MNIIRVLTGSLLASVALSQNYCDDAYGAHCPEESGWDVGDCLSKLDVSLQGEKCHDFITLHDTCRAEIDEHCVGKEYTGESLLLNHCVSCCFPVSLKLIDVLFSNGKNLGDVLPCLTEWTSIDLISDECKALFPVKAPKPEKRKKTKKEKERDKKRKKYVTILYTSTCYFVRHTHPVFVL